MPQRPTPAPSDLDAMSELFEAVLAEQRATNPESAATSPPPPPATLFDDGVILPPVEEEERRIPVIATVVNYAIYLLGGALIIGIGVWLLAPEETIRVVRNPALLIEHLDNLLRSVLRIVWPAETATD